MSTLRRVRCQFDTASSPAALATPTCCCCCCCCLASSVGGLTYMSLELNGYAHHARYSRAQTLAVTLVPWLAGIPGGIAAGLLGELLRFFPALLPEVRFLSTAIVLGTMAAAYWISRGPWWKGPLLACLLFVGTILEALAGIMLILGGSVVFGSTFLGGWAGAVAYLVLAASAALLIIRLGIGARRRAMGPSAPASRLNPVGGVAP